MRDSHHEKQLCSADAATGAGGSVWTTTHDLPRLTDEAFQHMFAERDPLTKLIQSAILTLEALDKIKQPKGPDPAVEFDGYCARSCAAYLYLVTHDERAAFARSRSGGLAQAGQAQGL